MKRLSKIIDLLQNKNFELSKEIENPTIKISNAFPMLSFPTENITTATNFELRARHNSKKLNESVLKEIHLLLGEDSSFLKENLDGFEGDIGIFNIKYKAPKCL